MFFFVYVHVSLLLQRKLYYFNMLVWIFSLPAFFACCALGIVFWRLTFDPPSVTKMAVFGTWDRSPLEAVNTVFLIRFIASCVLVREFIRLKKINLVLNWKSVYQWHWNGVGHCFSSKAITKFVGQKWAQYECEISRSDCDSVTKTAVSFRVLANCRWKCKERWSNYRGYSPNWCSLPEWNCFKHLSFTCVII